MQRIMGYMRKAMDLYHMVEEGDRIAVGVSGGKDSVALLYCLARMRHYYPKQYEVVAITLDPFFEGQAGDYAAIEELCASLNVDYICKETNIAHVVFDTRKEKNPCSLCSKLRRGILHETAKEAGCNKVALGHHYDDVVETYMMEFLDQGALGCFSPVTYLTQQDITVIRPMIFVPERDIINAVKRENLPVVKSPCPADKTTEREHVKQLIAELEQTYPSLRKNIVGILQKNHIAGW